MVSGSVGGHLDEIPLFAELPPGMLAVLASESRVRRYPEGQVLFSEGDPGDALLILEEGRVKVCRFMAGGQEIVLAVQEAPASFGELALVDGAPRSATVIAQTAVVVRMLPRAALMGMIHNEPTVAMALMEGLVGMIRNTNDRLSDLQALDVPGRVAKWLLGWAERSGQQRADGVAIPFEISQSDLAAELGTTRVSINKALRMFESLDVIASDKDEIVIMKPERLQEYVY
ncbi:MAG TPA: Crp/Fnr family transcriptional regulator [Thermomicrobiales bacterium]|nr:Crp/Fnr family transcriptional regulator [Thermomicrobiales bacterium]